MPPDSDVDPDEAARIDTVKTLKFYAPDALRLSTFSVGGPHRHDFNVASDLITVWEKEFNWPYYGVIEEASSFCCLLRQVAFKEIAPKC